MYTQCKADESHAVVELIVNRISAKALDKALVIQPALVQFQCCLPDGHNRSWRVQGRFAAAG